MVIQKKKRMKRKRRHSLAEKEALLQKHNELEQSAIKVQAIIRGKKGRMIADEKFKFQKLKSNVRRVSTVNILKKKV